MGLQAEKLGGESEQPEQDIFQSQLRSEAARQRLGLAFRKGLDIIRQAREDAGKAGLPAEEIHELYQAALGEGE